MNNLILGIIPARGGSKGIEKKNLQKVGELSLLEHAIRSAHESKTLTEFVVTTDNPEMAKLAEQKGVRVVNRPTNLAGDETPMIPVVLHVLEQVETDFEFVVLLQPTAPFRTGDDIDAAVKILIDTKAESVVSVYEVKDHHPSRMHRLSDGRLISFDDGLKEQLRQKLPPVYHRNGAIYACKRELILQQKTLMGYDNRPYIMPREKSVNIDDELDLAFANFLVKRMNG